jgi:DNA repair exonuclease SbcCD nuclease subunit
MARGSFRFAHLADAHVGAWARDPSVRQALRESVLKAIEVAADRGCEFLLVSGDLFHTPVPEPAEVAPVAAALRRFIGGGRRVYVIYGSHDYVAHRTSWLDVLAETGLFLRAAPEAVREEGQRWTLPYLTDEPTGARIAGVSGRSHGLDRSYFAGIDAESFRAAEGFKIFQFHAAVREYLPPQLRQHILGISREDLPGGCDYYAGGHIHYTYTGTGPDGGILVNPGAVFGTSTTDLENGILGKTRQGVVIVNVANGVAEAPEWVDTAPKDRLRVLDIDISGKSAAEARAEVHDRVQAAAQPGALIFPRLHGTLPDGSLAALGLGDSVSEASERGASAVHWDVHGIEPESPPEGGPEAETALEAAALRSLASQAEATVPWLGGTDGERRLRELLAELGTPRGEGEAKGDYESARVAAGLRILRRTPEPPEP